jgi:hypothetical protein
MRKNFFHGILLTLLAVLMFTFFSCKEDCGGGCKVSWTSDGKKGSDSGACYAFSCSSHCNVAKNWSSNKSGLPGQNVIIRCDCE